MKFGIGLLGGCNDDEQQMTLKKALTVKYCQRGRSDSHLNRISSYLANSFPFLMFCCSTCGRIVAAKRVGTQSRRLRDAIDQLLTTDLAGLHVLHALQGALETPLADRLGMRLELALGEQLFRHGHEGLCELEVFGAGRERGAELGKLLAEDGVHERADGLDVVAGALTLQNRAVALWRERRVGREGVGAELCAVGFTDRVPRQREGVVCQGADLGCALWVAVVEGFRGSKALDVLEVGWRARSQDRVSRPGLVVRVSTQKLRFVDWGRRGHRGARN